MGVYRRNSFIKSCFNNCEFNVAGWPRGWWGEVLFLLYAYLKFESDTTGGSEGNKSFFVMTFWFIKPITLNSGRYEVRVKEYN